MDLKGTIQQIRNRETDHLKTLRAALEADKGAIFPADLIIAGVVQRSLMLTKGFLRSEKGVRNHFQPAGADLQAGNMLSPLFVPFNRPSKLARYLSGTGAD